MKSLQLGLFLVLMLCACRPSSSQLDIVRGRPVAKSSPAFFNTVRVEAQYSSCSASIIGERLILTAAHCVEDVEASKIKVVFERPSMSPGVETKIDVSRVQMFKKEGAAFFPQFDIAWLELKETIPAPFKPMEVLRDPSLLKADTPILLAGYGMQKDDCSNTVNCSRVLQEGNTELKAYYDEAHIMSLMVFFGDPQKNLSGACFGDSGGPAYAQVQGQWYVIGVTNGFTKALAPLSDGTCESGWDVYTFAGDYIPWLERTSGYGLPVADSRINSPRATPPKIISGIGLPRPGSWSEWVTYANHEDPAWSTVDSILLRLAEEPESLGFTRENVTGMLINPQLTQAALTTTSLWIRGHVTDLTPLQYFTALQSLNLTTPELTHIEALDALPQLTSVHLQGTQKLADDILDQVPLLQTRLNVLTLVGFAEDALARLGWKQLHHLTSLKILDSTLDLTHLSELNPAASSELSLDRMTIKGTFAPTTMPGTLRLSRVKDHDNRPGLAWLEKAAGLKALYLTRMPADSLLRLPDFSELINLGVDYMGLTQLNQLTLPPSLTTLSVSGNRLTSLTAPAGWQPLQQLSAYDNPLMDTTCPAASCRLDQNIQPQSIGAFCENVARWEFSYSYETILWSILTAGPMNTDRGWIMKCEGIDALALSLTSLRLNNAWLEDIRPLAYLAALKTLDLSNTGVRDFSPLAALENLQTVYLFQVQNFDLSVLQKSIGVTAMGMVVDDLAQASCPLLAGSCGFTRKSDQKYEFKPGVILGARKPMTHVMVASSLPGLKKTFHSH